jgi:hypothetical protein
MVQHVSIMLEQYGRGKGVAQDNGDESEEDDCDDGE